MNLDASFFKEEVMCDYLVSAEIKKVWAVELDLLEQLDRVCQKYGLRYFADYGTLLGAARHQGFIPWDDDIDVTMMRDDYENLKIIAADEFSEPYFFQSAYTDNHYMQFSKLMNVSTSAIEFPNEEPSACRQGIFLDIFPLDDVPDGSKAADINFKIRTEILITAEDPQLLSRMLNENYPFQLPDDMLLELIRMPTLERLRQYELFSLSNQGCSTLVNTFQSQVWRAASAKKREWFEHPIRLPFENTTVPAFAAYEEYLSNKYGDWHKFVRGTSNHRGTIFCADMPYDEFLKSERLQEILRQREEEKRKRQAEKERESRS